MAAAATELICSEKPVHFMPDIHKPRYTYVRYNDAYLQDYKDVDI